MARSHRYSFSLSVMAGLAIASVVSFTTHFYSSAAYMVRNVVSYACEWAVSAVEKFKRIGWNPAIGGASSDIAKGREHAARFMKRQRPVQFSSWKMCPSV